MNYYILALLLIGSTSGAYTQQIEGKEIGTDIAFTASTNSGNFGIGPKFGFRFNEHFIAGPSFRYQRLWSKQVATNQISSFHTFGLGAFAHGRFFNALFMGAELEVMNSPLNSVGQISTQQKWIPSLFVGGGYSQEFNETIRINAGIMYDLIDHIQSPFRTAYFIRNSNSVLLPVIYRIAFFFPLD